ncbi:MAG: type II toxin-antitoxin system prevent-host-death family antitoxin [Syntrophales bacterium]|nr:type II toxin-antitoxin system prevent-host-death family antitoxin [Syntrophales bacterium]
MIEIGAYEAKTHLPRLLDRVMAGEEITITRRGVPVAVLVPVKKRNETEIQAAIEGIMRLRQGPGLSQAEIRQLIEEGRE